MKLTNAHLLAMLKMLLIFAFTEVLAHIVTEKLLPDVPLYLRSLFDVFVVLAFSAIPLYFLIFLPLRKLDEKQLKVLLETMSEGVVIRDQNNKITQINNAALRIFKLTADSTIDQLNPSQKWKLVNDSGEEILHDQNPSEYTLRTGIPVTGFIMGITTESGEQTWVSINTIPIKKSKSGKVLQIMSTINDISDRKRAELRYKKIFDGLNKSALVSTTDKNGKITYANDTFSEISQYSNSELIGKDHRIINSGFHNKLFFQEMWGQINAGKIWKGEIKNKKKNGDYYWVESTIVPILDSYGMPEEFISIRYDKTEKKQLEEQLENEHLKLFQSSRMASLGEMAGGIAHEINNPLAVIKGKAQQIESSLKAQNASKEIIVSFTQKIIGTVDRVAKIVSGLKLFSRDSTNDEFINTSIESIITETLAFCQTRLENHAIKLNLNVDQNINIDCRPSQISQVLLNLINNAHDAIMEEREKLSKINADNEAVFNDWIEVSCESKKENINIRVTNSGSKIPKDIQEKIFLPFYTTKEIGKGTGLGLSISVSIVKMHAGHLYLNSDHENTQFVIELPIVNTEKSI